MLLTTGKTGSGFPGGPMLSQTVISGDEALIKLLLDTGQADFDS
jgi:hypothetical protein